MEAALTRLLLGSLGAVLLTSCTVGSNQPAPRTQRSASHARPAAPHSYDPGQPFAERAPAARTLAIAPSTAAAPLREAGLEVGFTHCCGDVGYAMQVDCSDRLMRCYENDDSAGWQQTYGRNCKEALGQGCYEQGCLSACEGN